MTSTRVTAVALLVIFILNSFLLQTESASCCLSYTKKNIKCQRMKGYTIQTLLGICDRDAIIFHGKRGNFICADPSKEQTQKIIHCLNARTKALSQRPFQTPRGHATRRK